EATRSRAAGRLWLMKMTTVLASDGLPFNCTMYGPALRKPGIWAETEYSPAASPAKVNDPPASGWVVRSEPSGPWRVLRVSCAEATLGPAEPALKVPLTLDWPPLPPGVAAPTVRSTDARKPLLEPAAESVALPGERFWGRAS